jgi:zinc D-Ala-D-Ala carboxypeptidase
MKYFKMSEFSCKHCGENKINEDFVKQLDVLRGMYGKPLIVSSGYRCPVHNARVSSTGANGPHTTGLAADLLVDRGDAYRILELVFSMQKGIFTGVGVHQKGGGRFIHLDMLPNSPGVLRPTVWSY